jgi:Tfp pilus assembly protein PilX
MIRGDFRSSQRGMVTMFVTMVLLILITLMVITAYSLSDMNLKTVGNLQTRKEAIAAAESAIERAIDGSFTPPPTAKQPFNIDVDNDGTADYQVEIDIPICLRATEATIVSASSVTLPGFSSNSGWNTVWLLEATSTNAASGTRVKVRQGLRVLMSEAQKNSYCPT